MNEYTNNAWYKRDGSFKHIDVDGRKRAWAINEAGAVYEWVNGWQSRGNMNAADIGACGDAYITTKDVLVKRYLNGSWKSITGFSSSAKRIDVSVDYSTIVSNTSGEVFISWQSKSRFQKITLDDAIDVSINSDAAY